MKYIHCFLYKKYKEIKRKEAKTKSFAFFLCIYKYNKYDVKGLVNNMLINNNCETTNNVKFISYSGKYPNLCRGILILEIDGKECKFGHNYEDYNMKTNSFNDNNYDKFWSSGGGITRNYNTYQGEWEIDVNAIPEQFKKYASEIDKVFNGNVPYGCCGGCI